MTIEDDASDGPIWSSSPDDLRSNGWAVAIHNDYRVNGEFHTFWLLTKDGRALKGEAISDALALDEVRRQAGLPIPLGCRPSAASEPSSPLRPAVLWFAREMEEALRRNDHKGTWIDCDTDYLWSRLKEEIRELKKALDSDAKTSRVTREAADVANFAMMLADTSSSEVHDDAWYSPIEKEPADPVKRESPCRRCALEREEAIRERDRLRGELTETKAKLEREEREHGHTIDQRERYHDAADRLAYAIADEEVIGEHSSSNDPWEEALEALEAERRKHSDDLAKELEEACSCRDDYARELKSMTETVKALTEALKDAGRSLMTCTEELQKKMRGE